jgi:alpha-tubulin suppressor-like RCC1 family protein
MDTQGDLCVWGRFIGVDDASKPKKVTLPIGYTVKLVALGTAFLLILTEEGPLFSFGKNSCGELGVGDQETHTDVVQVKFPTEVGAQPEITYIACGDDFALAVTSEGQLYGWGCNNHAQCANYDCENHWSPILSSQIGPTPGVRVASVCGGCQHAMILAEDGRLFGTGCNYQGQLGLGDQNSRKQIEQVDIPKVLKVLCGNFETSALTHDGSIYIWGDDRATSPQKVYSGVEDYVRGLRFHIFLMFSGETVGWGKFENVEVGDDQCDDKGFFNFVLPKPNIPIISWIAGADFGFAVRQNGTVLSWGSNISGQLGLGGSRKYQISLLQRYTGECVGQK